jgi:hypothetical protein
MQGGLMPDPGCPIAQHHDAICPTRSSPRRFCPPFFPKFCCFLKTTYLAGTHGLGLFTGAGYHLIDHSAFDFSPSRVGLHQCSVAGYVQQLHLLTRRRALYFKGPFHLGFLQWLDLVA